MAQTSVGFAGTVNDAEWAVLSSFLGNQACVSSQASLAVTPVGGARSVSVAAGVAYGDGVQTTLSAPETVALTTPTNGQWYLIVLRRVWATKVSSLVAIVHTTTTTTVPTSAPTTYPAGMLAQPGIQSDQPLAWAWCNSANTTVITSDLRQQPIRTIIQQPNPIINGGMDIWQRGTTFNGIANMGFAADRWSLVTDGVGTVNATQQDVSAHGLGCRYALRAERSAGTNRWVVLHMAEGALNYVGKTLTLSFLIRKGSALTSDITASISTRTAKFGTQYDSASLTVTNASINAATFTRFSFQITVTSATSAVSADLFEIEFSASQAGAAGAYFEITGVQLEVGSVATPFRRAGGNINGELAACQKYYVRFTASQDYAIVGTGTFSNSDICFVQIPLPVTMRATPSISETANIIATDRISIDASISSYSQLSMQGAVLSMRVTHSSGATLGRVAQLAIRYAGSYIALSAEL